MAKRYWLMKSEPHVYSIDQLRKDKTTGWNGVRNYQARNHMKAMSVGDEALFYHSAVDPAGAAGVMSVARAAYPDPTQFDSQSEYYEPRASAESPVWFHVDVRFKEEFPRLVAAAELKEVPALQGMILFKNSRLSVQPVTPAEWTAILALARSK